MRSFGVRNPASGFGRPGLRLSALGMYCLLHGKILQASNAGAMPSAHLFAQYRGMQLSRDSGTMIKVRPGKVLQWRFAS